MVVTSQMGQVVALKRQREADKIAEWDKLTQMLLQQASQIEDRRRYEGEQKRRDDEQTWKRDQASSVRKFEEDKQVYREQQDTLERQEKNSATRRDTFLKAAQTSPTPWTPEVALKMAQAYGVSPGMAELGGNYSTMAAIARNQDKAEREETKAKNAASIESSKALTSERKAGTALKHLEFAGNIRSDLMSMMGLGKKTEVSANVKAQTAAKKEHEELRQKNRKELLTITERRDAAKSAMDFKKLDTAAYRKQVNILATEMETFETVEEPFLYEMADTAIRLKKTIELKKMGAAAKKRGLDDLVEKIGDYLYSLEEK